VPVLSSQDQQTLKTRFKKELKRDITIVLYTMRGAGLLVVPGRECPTCPQTKELLEEVVSLSPKLSLEIHDVFTESAQSREQGIDKIPCITFSVDGQVKSSAKFYGLPAGHEFATLVEDIIAISRDVCPLRVPTRKALRQLKEDIHIQVFVTPG
jgi:alkyl hydroperoxide reductase subunit AhpF